MPWLNRTDGFKNEDSTFNMFFFSKSCSLYFQYMCESCNSCQHVWQAMKHSLRLVNKSQLKKSFVIMSSSHFQFVLYSKSTTRMHWHSPLTLYTDTLQRHSALTLCTDTLHWHSALTLCTDTLHWHSALTLCTDTLH